MIELSESPDIHFLQMIEEAKLDITMDTPSTHASQVLLDYVHYVPGDFSNNINNYSHPRAKKSPILPKYPSKVCSYYMKGLCKYGKSCKNIHVTRMDKDKDKVYSPDDQDHHVFYSLEKLEMELVELLRFKGTPISIATLPMLYLDVYGRSLQAEGYLSESQRNGKAGFSLTMLLRRLPSILVLDRPHGQHSVVLAEDGSKYSIRGKREQRLSSLSAREEANSRQVYLTFPAESTFTEQDVFNYFETFGHVQDVRLPSQVKRMYGFVAFKDADTVIHVLSKVKSHSICGSRVLAKPYMDKHQLMQKKFIEKFVQPFSSSQYQMFQSKAFENSRFHKEKRRMEEQQFIANRSYIGDWKSSDYEAWKTESMYMASTSKGFNYQMYPNINDGASTSNYKQTQTTSNYDDQDHSDFGLNLPDNEFTFHLPDFE